MSMVAFTFGVEGRTGLEAEPFHTSLSKAAGEGRKRGERRSEKSSSKKCRLGHDDLTRKLLSNPATS